MASKVALSIKYMGPSAPPHPAVTPTANIRREEITAVSSARGIFLHYYKPLPIVDLAQHCTTCNAASSCICGNICGLGKCPLLARRIDVQVPLSILFPQSGVSTVGVLKLSVSELLALSVSDGQITEGYMTAIFGDRTGTVTRVLWSYILDTRIEIIPPPRGSAGAVMVSVVLQAAGRTPVKTAYTAVIVDDAVSVLCTVVGSGPSDETLSITLEITKFPRVDPTKVSSLGTYSNRVRTGRPSSQAVWLRPP